MHPGRARLKSSPEEQARAGLELRRRARGTRPPPLTFREFVSRVNPRFVWYRYAEVAADVIERVVSGEIRRLIVMAPPRHGKSELFSRLLPAYFVYRNPDKFAAIASYGARLAEGFNRHARRHYFAMCGIDRTETTAVEHWETGKGGGCWAVGVGGGSTGKGFSFGGIDDPVKDDQDAQSEVIRSRTTDWYESVWSTRLAPDAAQGRGVVREIQLGVDRAGEEAVAVQAAERRRATTAGLAHQRPSEGVGQDQRRRCGRHLG